MTWIVQAPAGAASRQARARVELVALAATAFVTIALAAFAVTARLARAGDAETALQTQRVVGLWDPDVAALAAAFQRVWPQAEAAALASEVAAAAKTRPLASVGDLLDIRIAADRVRASPALVSARARLEAQEQSGRPADAVPLLRRSEVAALKPGLIVRQPAEFRTAAALSVLLVIGGFAALHVLRRMRGLGADPLLLPAVQLLCGFGLAAMIGLRDPLRDALSMHVFASGVALGCAAAALAWVTHPERLRLQYVPLLLAVVLSALLMLFGTGPAGSDARVNLWGFQPVEPIRLLIVVYLAAFFGGRWQYLRTLRNEGSRGVPLLRWLPVPPLEYVVPVAAALTLVAIFFVLQRDLGPALVFGTSFLALWVVATHRAGLALAGLALLGMGYWAVVRLGFPATLATRVAMASDPWGNAVAGGDQVAHALWALASGGIVGAGPGMGDPQYIPAGHTDLVLAAIGEETGFAGLLVVALAYLVIAQRAWRIAMRAASDFTCFLAFGLFVVLFTQLAIIAGGVVGLMPLSGVVTPFLSYGRTSMIVNLAIVGVLLAISERGEDEPRQLSVLRFARPARAVTACLAVVALVTLGRVLHAQVLAAGTVMAKPALVRLADGTVRFDENPRLLAAARQLLPRGTIADRNGLPLATNGAEALQPHAKAFAALGVDVTQACRDGRPRCYPLAGRTYHILGDANTQIDWTATNNSFVEEDDATRLLGYDSRGTRVTLERAGERITAWRRDYSALVPLVRHRYRPDHPEVRALRERPRDLRLTIDARLQTQVADILASGVRAAKRTRGAAAVIDAASGEVLAAASYPWPSADALEGRTPFAPEARLDRVRYGTYPPGSTLKLLTAAAVLELRPELASSRHMCVLLPDGRAGARLPGVNRPIRDDALDVRPHGHIGLDEALRVSCNAYFAQLARDVGPQPLLEMAERFHVDVASPNTVERLRPQLPYAAFGQGEATVRPMRLLGITAAIANGGMLVEPRWTIDPGGSGEARAVRILSAANAARLARDMTAAVATGTGRNVARIRPAIAGKTGTAEVDGQPSHAWFTGFAPAAGAGRRLAFVVLVEGGGYGGRTAAPIAGRIVEAARALRLFDDAAGE